MKHAFKKIVALLLAVAMIVGILPAVLAANELPFTDVKETDWFAPYVDFVYNHEPQLMNGMTEETFGPQGTLTRAMAAVVLYRLADPVIPSIEPSTFTDLTADWYKNGVAWAQQHGVVNGISEDKFDPEGLVTREQLVTMIWRYNDSPMVEKNYLKNFPDASKISDYAKDAFNWAVSKKIISGTVNSDDSVTLNPQGYATRAEFAKIIAVFADVTMGCEAGHSWDEGVISVEPTCTEPGEKLYTCVRCDETKTEEIPAMGHTYYDGACYLCGEALAAEGDIVIYYTNDVHTYIDGAMSYDTIADLKDQTKKIADGVLLVDAGDHIQGTAYGSMDKGETIIELMNAAGYDLATLGNHEFDYGMERALELVGMAEYPYVSSNFYHEKDGVKGDNVLDAYRMFEISGVKIAFVGVTTPETFTKSTPAYFQDEAGNYIYGIAGGETGTALYASVQAAINAAKADGADYIIALGHLGDDPASQPWTSEELIANTVGLDAFIDGHSHSTVEGKEVTDKAGNAVLLTQTGEYFKAIGKMTINEDGITTELLTGYTGSDATVDAIKDAWIAEIETQLGEVIGYAEVTFDNYIDGGRIVRKQETNTGDFAADALYYLFDNMGLDVDVAIMNGGGVRNKAITGEISYLTCKSIHTFGNVACLQTITGQQLLDALEWGARGTPDEEIGGFLHVSGITYEIHTDIASTVQQDDKGVWAGAPTGEYRVKNVMVGGEPLDLDAKYNLAGYNYTLRDLGDGFAMFDGAVNVLDYVMEDYQVLANYVKSFEADAEHDNLPTIQSDSIYAEVTGAGRITIVQGEGGTDEPDTPDTPDTPDDPKPPVEGNTYVLTNELKAGDEVIIVCAAKNMALSSTYSGFYNSAVAVNPVDGVITDPAADIVWTVGKNGNNYTFSFDGKNIGMADSYSSMPLGEKNDQWTISAGGTANTWFIFNVGRQVYMEYYETNGNWSGYYNNSVAELFEVSFYVKGGAGTGGDTPDTPDDPKPPVDGNDYVLSNELKAGDEVIIVCAAKNMALSSTYSGFYNSAVAVNPVDGVITDPAADIVWTVGKNGNNYTFSFDGKNLGMADSYSSMPLGEKNDQWTISAGGTANTWFVFNVGRQVYIEYYETNGNWSGYYNNSVAELFELSFYVKGGAGTGGETPEEPEDPDTPDVPTGDLVFEKVTADQGDWSGTYVIGWDDGSNVVIFNGETDKDQNFVASTISGNKVTAPASCIIIIEKVDGGYSLKATGGYLNGKLSSGAMANGLAFETSPSAATITWANGTPTITSKVGTVLRYNNGASFDDPSVNYSWFRFFKPTSSVQTPVVLYKLTDETPDTPDTPDEPEIPEEPEDPNPPAPTGYVAIYNNANSKLMTTETSVYTSSSGTTKVQMVSAAATLADGKLITDATNVALFKMETTDGVTTFVTADGKYLFCDGTNMGLVSTKDDNCEFVLEETDGGYFIRLANFLYQGTKAQYIEFYRDIFTCYGMGTDTSIYTFNFYELANGETPEEPDTPVEPEEPDTPVEPEEPVEGNAYVLSDELKDGDQVILFNPGSSKALSSTESGYYVAGVDCDPVDNTITTEDATIVWTVTLNDDDSYTFVQGDKTLGITPSGTYFNIKFSGAENVTGFTVESCNANNQTSYIYSSTLEGSYGHVYLEWYAAKTAFSAYCTSTERLTEDAFGFQFYVKSDELPCTHEWDNGTVTSAPTCTADGVLTITCSLCGATKTEAIAALGHEDNNGDNACDTCQAVLGGDLVATAFEDLKATDTVVIVISGPVSGKDYVMFNTASDSDKGAGAEFDGATVEDNMFWNIVPCNGGYTIYKAGSTTEWLYLTNANNGVRVGNATTGNVFSFSAPYEGQNPYLHTTDSTGAERYIGAYDNNNGKTDVTFNFRCYAIGASTGVLANIADQTVTFYVVG